MRRTSWASARGSSPLSQDHHVHGDPADRADQGVFHPDDELAFLLRGHRPVGHLGHAAADEVHAFLQELVVELLVALPRGPHVDVEVVDLGAGVLLHQVGQLQRVHAADARAPAVGLLVARADAVDDADRLGMAAVPQDDLAAGRAGGVDQPLDLQRGVDVRVGCRSRSTDVLAGSKGWKPGGQDDGPDLDLLDLLGLREVDALPIAGLDAGLLALARLELQAGLGVDEDDLGRGLREGDVDGLPLAQAHVELVGEAGVLVDAGRRRTPCSRRRGPR